MLQQVMTAPGEISFREVPVPEPKAGEVLIKVRQIGICGSDIHVYHGTHPFTDYPVTQGHEVSGEVVELGKGVNSLKIGDHVTVEPQVFCGSCYPCRHGKYNLCENLKVMGFQTTGVASEYFAVHESKVDVLPAGMSFAQGAMIEPVAVAVHAVERVAAKGKHVVVIGAGPIGNLVAQVAKAQGAESTLVTDISAYRLELARKCGIDHAFNSREANLGELIDEVYGADKADVIFDCAGNDDSIGQAIQYARKGSTIMLVAVFGKLATVDLAVLNDHELTLDTSMMYRHDDFVEAIRLVEEGLVVLEPLMSKTFSFRDYQQAYEFIESNREQSMKIFIDVQG